MTITIEIGGWRYQRTFTRKQIVLLALAASMQCGVC